MKQFDRAMRHHRGEAEPPPPVKNRERFLKNVGKAITHAREVLDKLERGLENRSFLDQVVLSEGNGLVIISNPEHVTRFEIQVDLRKGVGVRVQNTPSKDADCLSITLSKKN